jgi:hypothetical protein
LEVSGFCDKFIKSLHRNVDEQTKNMINKEEFVKQLKIILESRDKKGNIKYKEIINKFTFNTRARNLIG